MLRFLKNCSENQGLNVTEKNGMIFKMMTPCHCNSYRRKIVVKLFLLCMLACLAFLYFLGICLQVFCLVFVDLIKCWDIRCIVKTRQLKYFVGVMTKTQSEEQGSVFPLNFEVSVNECTFYKQDNLIFFPLWRW